MTNKNILTTKQAVTRSKFIDISDRKEELQAVADSWTQKKAGTKGNGGITNQTNPKFIGLAGELVYARATGIEHELNLEYRPYGDGGVDFHRFSIDVKACTISRPAKNMLIENKDTDTTARAYKDPAKWAKYFVAVQLNAEQTGGWVVGWATKERLLAGDVREIIPGEGNRYVMAESELNSFHTDINYLFHLHKLSFNLPENELSDYMKTKRENDWYEYHHDYQTRVKSGLI
jgi:hypothetical protein